MKNRREIGSEFHIDIKNQIGHSTTKRNVIDYLDEFYSCYYDSGRSALRAILKKLDTKKVLLPNYICKSVRDCFVNCEVSYYNVDSNFLIDWADLLRKCSAEISILYIHFFNGYIGAQYDFEALKKAKDEYGFTIIEDTTHSFLTNTNVVGDYCIASLRKWFPVPDGGVLYSKKILPCREESDMCNWASTKREAMIKKGSYLNGGIARKEDFLPIFSSTEEQLDSQDRSYRISHESFDILKKTDIEKVSHIRSKNFSWLQSGLLKLGYLSVACGGNDQVPLCLVLKQENRDAFRKYLIDKHIYCPVHWPLYEELKQFDNAVSNHATELSIPIDQRYTKEHMDYIVECVRSYKG